MAGKKEPHLYTEQELSDRIAIGDKIARICKTEGRKMAKHLLLEYRELLLERDRRQNVDRSEWLSSRRDTAGFGTW